MTKRYSEIDQHDALYNLARNFPGGIPALARRMGMKSVGVLRQKLSPGVKTHYPSFEEVSQIIEWCQDEHVEDALLPLLAMNARHGLMAFPIPVPTDLKDEELTQSVYRVMSKLGAAAQEVGSALTNDDEIDDGELEKIEIEFRGALAALAEWRQRIRLRAKRAKSKGGRK